MWISVWILACGICTILLSKAAPFFTVFSLAARVDEVHSFELEIFCY
jgi:hypothetical protein